MASPIMKFFEYAHLPEKLQTVSKPIGDLAQHMDATLPDGAEKSAGLRKLLEAKDCLVRAAIAVVLLFAVNITIPDAAAQTPWHLQPMDSWQPGECYRSPNATSYRDDGDYPIESREIPSGTSVTADDLPGKSLTIDGVQEFHRFTDGRSAWAYRAKEAGGPTYWVPASRLTVAAKPVAEQRPAAHLLNGGPLVTQQDWNSSLDGLTRVLDFAIAEAQGGQPEMLRDILQRWGYSPEQIDQAIARVESNGADERERARKARLAKPRRP